MINSENLSKDIIFEYECIYSSLLIAEAGERKRFEGNNCI